MSSEKNIIKVYFKGTHLTHSKTQYQYNHGMILHFADLDLPQAFETHFANKQHGNSKTVIGSENKVEIPDEYFWTGANEIYAWVYLHSNVDDGETVYEVRIPLVKRAKPTDEEPLPEQQSAIDRAIAELSHAVETTNADAEQTSADREAVTELRDEVIDLKDEAEQSAQTATAKANEASESASSASESEQNAHDYADDAKRYAENAFSSKEIAVASASDAEQAKQDAEQARDDAQDARSDTIQLKQDVVGLKDDVTNLKDDVVNLKDDVIDLKEQTDTNVTHYPKIVDEYWHVWDATQNDFVNTGVDAEGEKGDKGDTGNSGVYIGTEEPTDDDINVWIDTDGQPDTIGLKYVKDDESDNGGVIEGLIELPEDAPPSISLNSATGRYAHAEGMMTTSSGDGSHAEGINTTSSNYGAHSEGYGTTASGLYSHAEGQQNTSSGDYSHTEGNGCVASEESAHAEGYHTMSQGYASHSEGDGTVAYGYYSHSEGKDTEAVGYYSHASGKGTIANGQGQFVIGEYNIEQGTSGQKVNTDCAFIVGNGTGENARSNAFAIKWNGNFVLANGTEVTPSELEQAKNIFVLEVSSTNGQTFSTTTTWSELNQARLDGRRIVLLVKYPNDTNEIVNLLGWTLPANLAMFERTRGSRNNTSLESIITECYDVMKDANSDALIIIRTTISRRIAPATANLDGIMSSTDKSHLDDLYANKIDDVQINGTSILSNGVANVPIGSSSVLGVVKASLANGTSIDNTGAITIEKASDSAIKSNYGLTRPIVPSNQHMATFYGLAKAAGDTTQSQSSNAVGTYTEEAKTAIRTMLGLEDVYQDYSSALTALGVI